MTLSKDKAMTDVDAGYSRTAISEQNRAILALADFTCAICQHRVDMRWTFRIKADTPLAPICRFCEGWYSSRIGKPSGGSHRDRREVRRGVALAEALHSEAMKQKWSNGHARA